MMVERMNLMPLSSIIKLDPDLPDKTEIGFELEQGLEQMPTLRGMPMPADTSVPAGPSPESILAAAFQHRVIQEREAEIKYEFNYLNSLLASSTGQRSAVDSIRLLSRSDQSISRHSHHNSAMGKRCSIGSFDKILDLNDLPTHLVLAFALAFDQFDTDYRADQIYHLRYMNELWQMNGACDSDGGSLKLTLPISIGYIEDKQVKECPIPEGVTPWNKDSNPRDGQDWWISKMWYDSDGNVITIFATPRTWVVTYRNWNQPCTNWCIGHCVYPDGRIDGGPTNEGGKLTGFTSNNYPRSGGVKLAPGIVAKEKMDTYNFDIASKKITISTGAGVVTSVGSAPLSKDRLDKVKTMHPETSDWQPEHDISPPDKQAFQFPCAKSLNDFQYAGTG